MLSRENRVILGSFVLAGVVFVALVLAESWLDVRVGSYPLLAFVIVAGLTVGLPQLYLARTDTSVSPRSRIRFAVIVTMIFAGIFAQNTPGIQGTLIIVIAVGAFLGLIVHEFVAGYRGSSTDRLSTE